MIPLLFLGGLVWVTWLYSPGLGVVLGIVLALYLGHCTIKPRADCLPWWVGGCGGGKTQGRTEGGHVFRLCPICKGRGHRTRPGAMIWRRNRYMFRDDPRQATSEVERVTWHDRGLF